MNWHICQPVVCTLCSVVQWFCNANGDARCMPHTFLHTVYGLLVGWPDQVITLRMACISYTAGGTKKLAAEKRLQAAVVSGSVR